MQTECLTAKNNIRISRDACQKSLQSSPYSIFLSGIQIPTFQVVFRYLGSRA